MTFHRCDGTADDVVALMQQELIVVKRRRRAPRGIDWRRLPREALEKMPVLAELRRRSQ